MVDEGVDVSMLLQFILMDQGWGCGPNYSVANSVQRQRALLDTITNIIVP